VAVLFSQGEKNPNGYADLVGEQTGKYVHININPVL